MASVGSNVVIKMTADASQVDLGMKRAAKATKNYENTTKKANQQLRFMRGGLGQVGHQVQDIAVQLQMGQNAMLVFGQQGSQIASLFGPGGAMIGAVMAVGAALLTSLAPALFGATEGLKEVRAETDTLIDRYDELTGASKEYAEILAKEKIQGYKDDIEKLNKSIEAGRRFTVSGFLATKEYTEEQEDFARRTTETRREIEALGQKIKETELAVDGTTTSFQKQSDALDRRTKQLKMSQEQIDIEKIKQLELKDTEEQALITKVKLFHQTQRQIEANKQFADGLKAQMTEEQNQEAQRKSKAESLIATLDMEIAKTQETEFANLSARIAVADLTNDERKLIQAKMDKLAALDQEKAALGKFAGWEKKTAKEKSKVMISESEKTLSAFAKNSKKAAALQKTIQIAQATMNTITGATAALKLPFPANLAAAAITIAKGMGMVATIRSQSFDGGGFTGRGARTGGVDGKGGFPAILHPNETVIDHTRGSGASALGETVVVNQTINVTTGVQSTVRAEIANLMPQISEAAQNAVLEARMRGGAYSKQLMGR